jgi:predicted nucleotidyltransferase
MNLDLIKAVPASLKQHPAVRNVELTGSRKNGTATRWSDWDFVVETTDFDVVSASLPRLTRNLEPISYLWDPLSDYWVFMSILKGPIKVDLIFTMPHQHEMPWVVNKETLNEINSHFWDWILWIGSKHIRGLNNMVQEELKKMYSFLLSPLGVKNRPASIEEAVNNFLLVFLKQKDLLQQEIDSSLEIEVLKGLRTMGFRV